MGPGAGDAVWVLGLTPGPGQGGPRGVGLAEKPWPEVLEVWVSIPSLPLTCCVILDKGPLPWALVSRKEFKLTPKGPGLAKQVVEDPGSAPYEYALFI